VVFVLKAFFWALAIIFRLEGGWYDGDGGTNYGITAATLRTANRLGIVRQQAIRKLTKREAAWIYYELYWLKSGAYKHAYPLDLVVFDAAVHLGPEKAKSLLKTVREKTRSKDPKQISRQYVLERYKHLRLLPRFRKYGIGWRKRMHIILGYVERAEQRETGKGGNIDRRGTNGKALRKTSPISWRSGM
jgi:lysozyme family protein